MKNVLYKVLTEMNSLLEMQVKPAQEEVPLIFTQMLQAEGCAVYILQEEGDYTLQHEHSLRPFDQTWRQYTTEIPLTVQYFTEAEKIEAILGQKSWSRALVLPFGANGSKGLLLAYWTGPSALDGLTTETSELWQLIAERLETLYYWRPLVERLKQREESLTALFRKSEQDSEKNRQQTGRRLHYEVGQTLTSVILQIKLLQESDDLEYVQGRLGGLKHIVSETLKEVQSIARNQRPILLDKLGLPAALDAYVQEYIETTKVHVELVCPEFTKRLPEQLETLVYRSVQEALPIETGRAGFSDARIRLSTKGDHLFLQISYNGCAEEYNEPGTRLLGIEERVKQARGKFWMMNQTEQNPCLNIVLPLN